MSVTKVTSMMSTGTKGGDIPSASTLVIDTDGDYFDITGTTGITAMTVDAGRRFTLHFDGALTLTHGSSLYLPGATNFTTEANDCLSFIATAANTVRCTGYALKDGGSPVVAPAVTDVKFLACLTSDQSNVTGDGTAWQTSSTTAWTEIYDIGSGFSNGTFTAPETGKYILFFQMYIGGISTSHTENNFYIFTSNRNYSIGHENFADIFVGANTAYNLGPYTIVADMDSGDTSTGYLACYNGSKTIDMRGNGTPASTSVYFGGALLA